MSDIPSDPVILLSWVNTQLRDFYPSWEELCETLDLNKEELEKKLLAAGFIYEPEINQFR